MDPFIFRRHRLRKALLEWLYERRNFRYATAIHFTSEEEMELAKLARDALPFDRGVVVPLGVRSEDYSDLPPAGTFRQRFPQVGHQRILLFLSRINFKKGLDLLIPAFGAVARARDDVHLALAGPDEDGLGKKVQSWIERERLKEKVTLTGILQGETKLAALRDASAFILPSYSENFGIAVVEAMACGLPVIISNRVNIWREVKAAGAGLVTNCNSVEIANAIEAILQDPQGAIEMGKRGRSLVQRQYCWPRSAELLENLYRDFLAPIRSRSGRTLVR
jgi:glycosyltransferase involved in cell wall biosynthesis